MMVLSLRPFFRGIPAKTKSASLGSAALLAAPPSEARSLKKPLEHVSRSAAKSPWVEISRRPARASRAARPLTRKPDAGHVSHDAPATLLHVLAQAKTLCKQTQRRPFLAAAFRAGTPHYEPR